MLPSNRNKRYLTDIKITDKITLFNFLYIETLLFLLLKFL